MCWVKLHWGISMRFLLLCFSVLKLVGLDRSDYKLAKKPTFWLFSLHACVNQPHLGLNAWRLMNKSVCRIEHTHTHAHTPVIPRSVFALHYTVKLFRNVNSPQWRAGYDTEPFETLFFCALHSFFARQLWYGTPPPYGNKLHISDCRLVGGQKSDQNQVLWTLCAHFSHQYSW